jgi:hypothetical protein
MNHKYNQIPFVLTSKPIRTKNRTYQKKEIFMKKIVSVVMLLALMAVSTLAVVNTASAEEVKMVGAISKIEMAADGKSATAILKDNKTGESVSIIVTDELTLDKFKDKRIVEGDEIRCKFDKVDGKNNSKIFKKTAGC